MNYKLCLLFLFVGSSFQSSERRNTSDSSSSSDLPKTPNTKLKPSSSYRNLSKSDSSSKSIKRIKGENGKPKKVKNILYLFSNVSTVTETSDWSISFGFREIHPENRIYLAFKTFFMQYMTKKYYCNFYIHSKTLKNVIHYGLSIRILQIFTMNFNGPISFQKIALIFEAYFSFIQSDDEKQFLSHFALSNENVVAHDIQFNHVAYFILSIMCHSVACKNKKDLLQMSDIFKVLLQSIFFDNCIDKILKDMFFSLAELKVPLKENSKNSSYPISVGLMSLVYSFKTKLDRGTNPIFYNQLNEMWDAIKNKECDLTNVNFSRQYQHLMFDAILKLVKSLNKDQDNTCLLKNFFTSMKSLIDDFKIIRFLYPYRILGEEKFEIFKKFVNAIKTFPSFKSEMDFEIIECIEEIEKFISLNFYFFFYDIIASMNESESSTDKNTFQIVFDRLQEFFIISDTIQKFKKRISEHENLEVSILKCDNDALNELQKCQESLEYSQFTLIEHVNGIACSSDEDDSEPNNSITVNEYNQNTQKSLPLKKIKISENTFLAKYFILKEKNSWEFSDMEKNSFLHSILKDVTCNLSKIRKVMDGKYFSRKSIEYDAVCSYIRSKKLTVMEIDSIFPSTLRKKSKLIWHSLQNFLLDKAKSCHNNHSQDISVQLLSDEDFKLLEQIVHECMGDIYLEKNEDK